MKLIIVESPHKAKTISGFLPADFKVMASAGHIRDLPKDKIAVSAPDYKPTYEITKPDIVSKLKVAVKNAELVLLATDPDREGEAIAAHLRDVLALKSPKRITYTEITQKAVLDAISKPRTIDANLVQAQEARRVLDRLVGYRVSGALANALNEKASAGRVQTPATRIVVDREREIQSFVSTEHFGVDIHFKMDSLDWVATWNFKPLLTGESTLWTDRAFAEKVSVLRSFKVAKITKEEKSRNAPAPFTTSTLQQAASIKLKMKPAKTMELAQKLYDDGHITYLRTDNPNLSEEASQQIWDYLRGNGMADYVPAARNVWKAKAGAQEAHEGIRPTNIMVRKLENADEAANRLYDLIWLRSVACQMKAEAFEVTTITLESPLMLDNLEFVASGRVQRFDGWRKLAAGDAASEDEESGSQSMPSLSEGDEIVAVDGKVSDKKTKPPTRYSEASLVKELESQGIGRPSTYASIMSTITSRGYVADEKDRLVPTELGFKVVDALTGKFAFADLAYTRTVEANFDLIAEGKSDYVEVVTSADNQITAELGKLVTNTGESHPCPACGKPLRRKKGPSGTFWGCTGYPDCKKTLDDQNGKPVTDIHPCPVCQKPLRKLIAKTGKNKGKPFWACTGYPDCKHATDDADGRPKP